MTDENPIPETPQAADDEMGQAGRESNRDARMWAMFCHLAGLAAFVPIIPAFGCVIGPLVIWLLKKEEFPFVNKHGKEALNFQISMFIYGLVAGLLCFVCVGFVLLPIVVLTDIILLVVAAIKANDGYDYHYPLTIRLVK